MNLSQNEFAARFGISPGTLRDGEQGRKKPEGPVLLMVIANDPGAVTRALKSADVNDFDREPAQRLRKLVQSSGPFSNLYWSLFGVKGASTVGAQKQQATTKT